MKRGITRRNAIKLGGIGIASTALHPVAALGQQKPEKFSIACVNSLSGGFARYGQELQRGMDIALERINAKGVKVGDKTFTFNVEMYDDKTDGSTCAKLVEKAVTSDNAQFVIGGVGSVIARTIIPVAQRLRVPMLALWAQVDGVFASQAGNPFLFGAMPPFSRYYTLISQMGANFTNPKIRRVAMITPSDELGVFTAKDYLPADVAKAGLELVGTEFFAPKSQDFGGALERVSRLNPDMLVINCYTPEIIAIFKEMQAVNFFPPMIVVEAPTKLHESIGDAINGAFVPTFWDPTLDKTRDSYIGTSREFAAAYLAKFNEAPPDFVAACGANNLVVLANVLSSAASLPTTEGLRERLRNYDGETFFSQTKFDHDGLNRRGVVYPAQFQKGKPVLVYPPDLRVSDPLHPYPRR
ncbi:ABC transporter substrate-binding protein [Bradyrhizobium sp. LjRoot220]|uniref:ABC transporter substrate-binding protein n=1 Tax=Bradyrhizobium sp. LjRoot220 TaxID=3342284 RepID=UPI003ECE61A3